MAGKGEREREREETHTGVPGQGWGREGAKAGRGVEGGGARRRGGRMGMIKKISNFRDIKHYDPA